MSWDRPEIEFNSVLTISIHHPLFFVLHHEFRHALRYLVYLQSDIYNSAIIGFNKSVCKCIYDQLFAGDPSVISEIKITRDWSFYREILPSSNFNRIPRRYLTDTNFYIHYRKKEFNE